MNPRNSTASQDEMVALYDLFHVFETPPLVQLEKHKSETHFWTRDEVKPCGLQEIPCDDSTAHLMAPAEGSNFARKYSRTPGSTCPTTTLRNCCVMLRIYVCIIYDMEKHK